MAARGRASSRLRRFDGTAHRLIFGVFLVSGLAFLLLAGMGAERWTEQPRFPALAAFGRTTALYALTGVDIYTGAEMFRLQAVAEALLPAAALYLALVFPTDRSTLGSRALRYCFVGTLLGFVLPALVLAISGTTGGAVPVNVTGWFMRAFPLAFLLYGPRALALVAAATVVA